MATTEHYILMPECQEFEKQIDPLSSLHWWDMWGFNALGERVYYGLLEEKDGSWRCAGGIGMTGIYGPFETEALAVRFLWESQRGTLRG